jgi:hypothetical protein
MTNNQKLIALIKEKIGEKIKLNAVLADVLNCSETSAYRKTNDTTPLTVEEFFKLVHHFNIDINIFKNDTSTFLFKGNLVYNNELDIHKYFSDTKDLLHFIKTQNGTIHNLSKDLPLFYYFAHNELGWFKVYFMLKYILNDPNFETQDYHLHAANNKILKEAQDYIYAYQQTNTAEVWNMETLNTTLHQLEFACEKNNISDISILEKIFKQIEEILIVTEKQASLGKKVDFIGKKANDANFILYYNDLYLAHNSYYLEMENNNHSFVSFGVFNYMYTQNADFNEYTITHFNKVKTNSHNLNLNALERVKFFKFLKQKIDKSFILCKSILEKDY